jgi:hypothetical protein
VNQLVAAVKSAQTPISQSDGGAHIEPQVWFTTHQLKIHAKSVHFFQRDLEI